MPELRLSNSIVDDRYQVERCLSHGSYAEIFIARDLSQNGLEVIIKALNAFLQGTPDPDLEQTLIENFQNEAIALDKVCHPNIIRRLGHGTASDLEQTPFHYLVLEYMPGGDLLSVCRNHPLDLRQTIAYFEQIGSALEYAHSRQVIHRDIKPNNLLLSGDRKVVKIADFGVAKIAASESDEITRVGTNLYAPPEHHPDSQTADLRQLLTPSADVYSMAKTIFTAMTGRSPHQFVRQPIGRLPEEIAGQPWGSGLLAILNKATATEIESRYQSVSEFWADFSALSGVAEAGEAPECDPEATVVRSREGSRQATESAAISPGPHVGYGQLDRECAGHPEISQPEFQPHAVAISAGEWARPQKARIVIELPERAQPAERAEPGEPAAKRVNVPIGDRSDGVVSGAPSSKALEGQSAVDNLKGDSPPSAVAASPGSPTQVLVQPTKPMISTQRPGLLDRMRRDTQSLAWVRRMFVICLILAFIGLLTTIYLHFAGRDSGGSLIGVLEGSHKDGSIAGALNVYIRSEPDGDTMAMLPAGTRVRVLEDRNNWARIKILRWEGTPPADAPDTGWVYRRFIKFD